MPPCGWTATCSRRTPAAPPAPGVAVLRASLEGPASALVVAADIRVGLAGGPDESAGGDGAAALFVGSENDGPVVAEYLGSASATEEFLDRWRAPGDTASKVWEERFGEGRYVELGQSAWKDGLKAAGIAADDVTDLIVASLHGRAVRALSRALAGPTTNGGADVGRKHRMYRRGPSLPPPVCQPSRTRQAGAVIGLLSLADGADAFFFRVNADEPSVPASPHGGLSGGAGAGRPLREVPRLAQPTPRRAAAAPRSGPGLGTGRRPVPPSGSSVSSAAALPARARCGCPPPCAGADPGVVAEPAPMAEVLGTVATFTVDRLAYSPSPPIVFAVVDFDGGGRLPIELTDVAPDEVSIGTRVEMTFRRLSEADGIVNYFWKARPLAADVNEGDA